MTETVRILVDHRSQSTKVICPSCKREKIVANGQILQGDRSFRVKCPCHHVFILMANCRRFQRRPVDVTGDLMSCTSHKRLVSIHIISLSVDGIGFRSQHLKPQVGETFTVAFSLDDAAETAIVDDIEIRNVTANQIGAQFLSRNGYNPEVDFYLMAEDAADINP